jgi:hypothetical protein
MTETSAALRHRLANSWAVKMYEGAEWKCSTCGCSPVYCDCPTYTPSEVPYNPFPGTLVPAHGGDYPSAEACTRSFLSNAAFQCRPQGYYTTHREIEKAGFTHVQLRFHFANGAWTQAVSVAL